MRGNGPRKPGENVPFDSETRDTGLLSKNVATNLLDDGLRRWVGIQLVRLVLVVYIVSDAHKFATVVRASQQDDRDTQHLGIRNSLGIGSISLENEFVDANRNGAD